MLHHWHCRFNFWTGISTDANRADGDLMVRSRPWLVSCSIAANARRIPFKFGSTAPGALNVLAPKGLHDSRSAWRIQSRLCFGGRREVVDVTAMIIGSKAPRLITVRDWQGPSANGDSRLKTAPVARRSLWRR